MSQARITLRPPPNVEFVEGYPGIPAGHDRPHAEVRGSIELRLPAQGTKAKWVRVELKKVETLPGGGQSNTFYDFVGQSPVKVWEASGEWSLLNTQDFPFAIRIPESIPPTIALDKGAGIKYELNATLCTKGKKGFFFKKTDATLSTSHPIVIDKHELHSTWPVYAQPESRHVVEDLLILTVDRTHTCYGPGDRVKVLATFKNDGIPAAALRAFEFLLKETIIYRAGPNVSGKKGAPQVHVTPIGEQKVPVNMTVYQGQQHRAELGCFIPQTHTTTTVSAARHMDIAYSINVKAVMGTGKPLLMELPVTVSNWPRTMSIEAIRRIGPAPSLSLIAPISNAHQIAPNTIAATRPSQQQLNAQPGYNTAPAGRSGFMPVQQQLNGRNNHVATMSQASSYGDPITGPRSSYDEFGGPSHSAIPRITSPAIVDRGDEPLRRPPVISGQSQARRLTLANAEMDSEPESPPSVEPSPKKFMSAFEEKRQLQNAMNDSTPGGSGSSAPMPNGSSSPPRTAGSSQRTAWPTAEDEKQRLYNSARQKAQHTQQIMGNHMSPMPDAVSEASQTVRPDSPPAQITMPIPEPAPAPAPRNNAAHKKNTPWPTAEEEKMRLYNSAQNAAKRVQAQGGLSDGYAGGSGVINESPPATKTSFNERPGSSHGSSSMSHDVAVYPSRQIQQSESKSAGAQLYQHAISSMSRNPSAQASSQAISPPSPPAAKITNGAPKRSHPTAEEEKAALRYYEAKRAVDRHQHTGSMEEAESSSAPAEGPIPYEDLYPSGPSSRQGGSSQTINGYGRRMSEATSEHGISTPASPPPPMIPTSTIESAMSEKERLRRKYEAEDAASNSAASPPAPPVRASGSRASPPGYGAPASSRSQPLPPTDPSGPRLLTAAEEKARLRAQMEAEDAAAGGSSPAPFSGPSTPSPGYTPSRTASLSYTNNRPREAFTAPPPPPLAPRPPAEYIQQTQEEDLRTRAENVMPPSNTLSPSGADSRVDFGLSFRPFSPLDLGMNFDTPNGRGGSAPPPPPLPPKVPVSQ